MKPYIKPKMLTVEQAKELSNDIKGLIKAKYGLDVDILRHPIFLKVPLHESPNEEND